MDCLKVFKAFVAALAGLLRAALSVNARVAVGWAPDEGAVYETDTRHAPPEGSVVGKPVAPFEQEIGPNVNGVPEGEITVPLTNSPVGPSPTFDTVIVCVPIVPAATLPKPRLLAEKDAIGAVSLISGVTVTPSFTPIVSESATSGNVSMSVTVIVSLSETETVAGGAGGADVVVPAPLSEMACVKLEPLTVLIRLLKPALSAKVMVALGGVPDAGAVYEIVTRQAPPDGRVVGKPLAPFEHAIGPNVNGVPEGEITAPLSNSPVGPSPIFDTVMVCAPTCPAATLPKPRLLVEKNATGAVTLISGVTVTPSFTVIASMSATSGNVSASVTVIVSLSVTTAGVKVDAFTVSV
jgi:hypothetical protein